MKFCEEIGMRKVRIANPVRSPGVSRAITNELTSNGVNTHSSPLGDQVEDKLGGDNF